MEYSREIPKYGDKLSREDWLRNVEDGGFIDYDGFGYASDGTHMADKPIYPSEAAELPESATHVVWFNR